MQIRQLRIAVIHVLFCVLLLPGAAMADRLIMKNGDVVTGKVTRIAEEKVYMDPSYADEYGIDLSEVASIEAEQTFDVELADGSAMEARFAGAANGEQTLIVDEAPMSVGIADLARASEPGAEEIIDRWEGSGEVGFVNTTGNTETVALNMKLNFIRIGQRWRHRFTGTAMNTSEDGDQDNERYTVEVQSDRKLSEKSWLFGAFRWDSDKFGSYDPQTSYTAGYGYQLMKSDRHELKGEIGAGYRRLTETVSGHSSGEAIARFLLDDWWQIFNSTKWTNRLLIEYGASNTFTQFNTGLGVSMTDRLGVNLGFEVRNNTEIPPGDSEHTDTITSANLVYNF